MKVYISVSGGCIDAVLSDDKETEVEVWDWDNMKEEANEKESDIEVKAQLKGRQAQWDYLTKNLHVVG